MRVTTAIQLESPVESRCTSRVDPRLPLAFSYIAELKCAIATMRAPIATTTLLLRRSNEESFEVTLRIGRPYQVGSDPEEWACPVALDPLYKRLHDAHGGDAFQALCLATALALDLLHGFENYAITGRARFYGRGSFDEE